MTVHIKTLEAQLDTWSSKIIAFEAVTNGPGADDYRYYIDNLKAKYAAARERVKELKAAGDEKWDLHKTDIWIAWNEFENAFQDFQQFVLAEKGKQPMEIVITQENSGTTKNESTDRPHTLEQGTRICTHADKSRLKTWISTNALENVHDGSEGVSRIDESKVSKRESNSVISIKKKIDIRSVSSVENIGCGSVLRPNFRRHRGPHDKYAALNYEKFFEHIAQLCGWKEQPSGKSGKKKDEKCVREVAKEKSDLNDE